MRLIFGCAITQYFLALLAPSPWWVPDLVLIGLILGVMAEPSRWLTLSLCAGLFHALTAIRHPGVFFIGDLVIGGLTWIAPTPWDMTPRQLERILVGVSSVALMAVACWLDELWSMALVGLMLWRMGLTLLSVGLVRRLVPLRDQP